MQLKRFNVQRLLCLASGLGLMLLPQVATHAANLLDNGGFESGATGWKIASAAASWVQFDPTIIVNAAQAREGNNYAQVDWVSGESFLAMVHPIDVVAAGMTVGSPYTISVWHKAPAIGAGDSVRVNFTNVAAGGSAYTNNAGITGPQSAWTQQVLDFTLPAGQTFNTYEVQVNPSMSAPGTIYVDAVTLTAPSATDNMVNNPSFELGSTGWTVYSGLAGANTPATVNVDPANAQEGSRFAQVNWAAGENFMILYTAIDTAAKGMVPGNSYAISAWHRTSSIAAGNNVRLVLTNTGSGGSAYLYNTGISGTQSAWTQQIYEFTLPTGQGAANTYQLQVNPSLTVAGTIYVDNISLTAPDPNGNLLSNPGFELGSTGWQVYSGLAGANTPPTVTVDPVNAREGSRFAEVSINSGESYLLLYRTIDALAKGMVPGSDYTISMWYRTSPTYSAAQPLQMIFTNTPNTGGFWYNDAGVTGAQTTWTKSEMGITFPFGEAINTYTLQIRPISSGSGVVASTLYVDDTSIQAGTVPVTLSMFGVE